MSAETEQEDGKYTSFTIKQSGDTLRTHRVAVGLYSLEDGKVTRFKQVEADISGERTEIAELVGADVAELVLLNDDDLTYTLLEFSPETVDFVVTHIDKITDPMARTLCSSTAWEMPRAHFSRTRHLLCTRPSNITCLSVRVLLYAVYHAVSIFYGNFTQG